MPFKLLQLFDLILQNVASKLIEKNITMESMLFNELMIFNGSYQEELCRFIIWVISNNGREIYFANKCNIKFVHTEANLNKLKIFLYSNSHCNIQAVDKEWMERCNNSWDKHNMKINKKFTAKKLHPVCSSNSFDSYTSVITEYHNKPLITSIDNKEEVAELVENTSVIIEDSRKKNKIVPVLNPRCILFVKNTS